MSEAKLLQRLAGELRLAIVEMNYKAGSGHTGGSLSCAEILTVLYDVVLRVRPRKPDWPDRDRFILSKGHAAPALYATLARKGYFDPALLTTLRRLDSPLQGHPAMTRLPGIEMSTGSLGMGISVGVGMALAARNLKQNYRVFVLCGDGELQEGQNWEALMAMAKWKLDNLTVIVDRNHVQLDGTDEEIMPLGDLAGKLTSFGLEVETCPGHNTRELLAAFGRLDVSGRPAALIAETVKGKGVSFMEGQNSWHGKTIEKEEYEQAVKELGEALV
jgi:transketolase